MSPQRIDLCDAVSVRAELVHLPEYAAACSIPAKPSPSMDIGGLVQTGNWQAVEDQVLADMMTTSVIFLRHLKSRGAVSCSIALG